MQIMWIANNLNGSTNNNNQNQNGKCQFSYYSTHCRSDNIVHTDATCTNTAEGYHTNTIWCVEKEWVQNIGLMETDKTGLQGIKYKIWFLQQNLMLISYCLIK